LRRLSKIIHLSKSGNLILKLESDIHPRLGDRVFDSRLKEIGRIQDIFGPVAKPYISISPTTPDPSASVGKMAYSD
jgi:RNA-binding protein